MFPSEEHPSVNFIQERRYDIDWLRILAMLLVFLFHCARFFGGGGWHLKNPGGDSLVATLFIGLLDLWLMPLFFLLSGVGSWYALESRTGKQYLMNRVKRILLPLYGVGACIILLPQAYFEAITNGGFTGTFREGLPLYIAAAFTTPPSLEDPFFFSIFYGHLWFLQFLFLISLLVLPLLLFLKTDDGRRVIAGLAGCCGRWGGAFLFVVPLAFVRIALTHFFQGQEHSWAHFFYFTVFFVIGYILPADQRFTEGIKKVGWFCLVLGVVGTGAEGLFIFGLKYNYASLFRPGGEPFSLLYVLFNAIMSVAGWCWVAFVLSLGARHLNFTNKMRAYGNEAVLPFYILHQTVILCVGWYVIRGEMGSLSKFVIIAATSFALIMLVYELLVQRFNLMRLLFGMATKKTSAEKPRL